MLLASSEQLFKLHFSVFECEYRRMWHYELREWCSNTLNNFDVVQCVMTIFMRTRRDLVTITVCLF